MKNYVIGFFTLSVLLASATPLLAMIPDQLSENDITMDERFGDNVRYIKRVQIEKTAYVWESKYLNKKERSSIKSAQFIPTSNDISVIQDDYGKRFGVLYEMTTNKDSKLPVFLLMVKSPRLPAPFITFDSICRLIVSKNSGSKPIIEDNDLQWTLQTINIGQYEINLMEKHQYSTALGRLGSVNNPEFAYVNPSEAENMMDVQFMYSFQNKGMFILKTSVLNKKLY